MITFTRQLRLLRHHELQTTQCNALFCMTSDYSRSTCAIIETMTYVTLGKDSRRDTKVDERTAKQFIKCDNKTIK